MMTHIDGTQIRPYFNAGIIATRPEKRLLQAWRDTFFTSYRKPEFKKFYLKDTRYRVFMHQAVLSGVILSVFTNNEIQKLSPRYNYPLHLHGENVLDSRPIWIDELVTIRHEGFYKDAEWHKKIPAKEPLKKWIAEQLIQ
jgi:hypothetical protein